MHKFPKIPDVDKKGLREFGFVMAAVVGGLFGLFLPWVFDRPWPMWPWVIAVPFAFAGLVFPAGLRSVYRGWMRFGHAIGMITTPLIMGILFFFVITPIGLARRMLGKDSLHRHIDSSCESYRITNQDSTLSDMERPF
jgi:hypothetical protein